MTFLVVEDEPSMQIVLREFLERFGRVCVAGDLNQALSEMRRIPPPDFIFLDLALPGSNPENTLSHIQELRRHNPSATLVVLTGIIDEKLAQASRAMGADEFMRKADLHSQKDLWDTIKRALENQTINGRPLFDASAELLRRINLVNFA